MLKKCEVTICMWIKCFFSFFLSFYFIHIGVKWIWYVIDTNTILKVKKWHDLIWQLSYHVDICWSSLKNCQLPCICWNHDRVIYFSYNCSFIHIFKLMIRQIAFPWNFRCIRDLCVDWLSLTHTYIVLIVVYYIPGLILLKLVYLIFSLNTFNNGGDGVCFVYYFIIVQAI